MTMRGNGGGEILPFNDIWPQMANDAFVASGARVIGDVRIGQRSSIWFNCVLRGDVNEIRVGEGSNIQDGSVVHVAHETHPTHIGDHVLIGHMALVHGCILHDHSFVGMGSVIMDGCVIEEDGMLAAGSLLSPGKVIAAGELWMGRPARFVRKLTEDEIKAQRTYPPHYAALAQQYLQQTDSPAR